MQTEGAFDLMDNFVTHMGHEIVPRVHSLWGWRALSQAGALDSSVQRGNDRLSLGRSPPRRIGGKLRAFHTRSSRMALSLHATAPRRPDFGRSKGGATETRGEGAAHTSGDESIAATSSPRPPFPTASFRLRVAAGRGRIVALHSRRQDRAPSRRRRCRRRCRRCGASSDHRARPDARPRSAAPRPSRK